MTRSRYRAFAVGGAAMGAGLILALSTGGAVLHSAEDAPSLVGTIRSDSGQPLEGMTVSSRVAGSNITTSVFTDRDGQYFFPRLDHGDHKVWTQGQEFEAARTSLTLGGGTARWNATVKRLGSFEAQLPGYLWYMALPDETRQDRRMKEVFRLACMGCHSQNFTLISRYDQRGWKNIIDVMSRVGPYAYGDPAAAQKVKPNELMVHFGDELAAYLADVRGPGPSRMTFVARRPAGASTLMVVREYDVPEAGFGFPLFNDGSDWSQGAVDFMDEAHHHTMNATLDFNGDLWMSDIFNLTHTVARIDAKTGQVTKFAVVEEPGGPPANSHDIFTDDEGIVWFDMSSIGALGRVDPRSGKVEALRPPTGARVGVFAGRDGQGGIWVAGGGRGETTDDKDVPIKAMRYDTKTGTWKMFQDPLPNISGYGMAGDRTGNGWWAATNPVDAVVKASLGTGRSAVVDLPKATSDKSDLFTVQEREIFQRVRLSYMGNGRPGSLAIRKVGGDVRGDVMYAAAWYGGGLVAIDTRSDESVLHAYPDGEANAGYDASVDRDGNVWVAFIHDDMVGRFNPRERTWTTYPLPTLGVKTHGVQSVTVDGRVQVAMGYLAAGKVAKLEFRTEDEVTRLKAMYGTGR